MHILLATTLTLLQQTAPTSETLPESPPEVLILGDSISIGYTAEVQRLLAEVAHVVRPMRNETAPENCAQSANGLARIDAWLGDTEWDVIHFNFGLHDLKYVPPSFPKPPLVEERGPAILENPDARQLAGIEEYEANLELLVDRMQLTGARLVFATTTPIPEGSRGRLPGDELRYNAVAVAVMRRHGVAVDDLYAAALEPGVIQNKADVHFKQEGSVRLAQRVAGALRAELDRESDTLDLRPPAGALPASVVFRDPDAFIAEGRVRRGSGGRRELIYTRWPRELGIDARDQAAADGIALWSGPTMTGSWTVLEARPLSPFDGDAAWFDRGSERRYKLESVPAGLALFTSLDGIYWTPARHTDVLGLNIDLEGGEVLRLERLSGGHVCHDTTVTVLCCAAETADDAFLLTIPLR